MLTKFGFVAAVAALTVASPGSAEGPRAGDYKVRGTGRIPIQLGIIKLSGSGAYRWLNPSGKSLGDGRYKFAGANVTWLNGPLKTFKGEFVIDGGGREHKIFLNRGTVAVNFR
jgi:hypothetical protein